MNDSVNQLHLRFLKVFEYIDNHLDDSLSLDELCEIACFSKFHFLRMFSRLYGVGVYEYIRLCRLKKATYLLAFREDQKIIEVALESGFESAESFSRAFRKGTGQAPGQFRKNPQWSPWLGFRNQIANLRRQRMGVIEQDRVVKIVNVEEIRLAVLEHRGSPGKIGDSIRKFIHWRRENGLSPVRNATFNILYNDPDEVSSVDYQIDICVETSIDITGNDVGLINKTLPAGRCAILRHTGSDETLSESIKYLYGEWFPQSGEELRNFPLYIQRVRFYPDVPENQAIIDIYLPLNEIT